MAKKKVTTTTTTVTEIIDDDHRARVVNEEHCVEGLLLAAGRIRLHRAQTST